MMHRIALLIQFIILGRSLYNHPYSSRVGIYFILALEFGVLFNAQTFMYVFMIMQTIFYVELLWQPINVLK